jgi:hypothetical protein
LKLFIDILIDKIGNIDVIMVGFAEFIAVKESEQRFFGDEFLRAGENDDYWDGLFDD